MKTISIFHKLVLLSFFIALALFSQSANSKIASLLGLNLGLIILGIIVFTTTILLFIFHSRQPIFTYLFAISLFTFLNMFADYMIIKIGSWSTILITSIVIFLTISIGVISAKEVLKKI